MSMFTMPTPPGDTPYWETRVQLEDADNVGAEFIFVFKFQRRRSPIDGVSGRYTLDFLRIDGTPLLRGRACCVQTDLWELIPLSERPPGQLFVFNNDERDEPPRLGDWDTRSRLYWVPPAGWTPRT